MRVEEEKVGGERKRETGAETRRGSGWRRRMGDRRGEKYTQKVKRECKKTKGKHHIVVLLSLNIRHMSTTTFHKTQKQLLSSKWKTDLHNTGGAKKTSYVIS